MIRFLDPSGEISFTIIKVELQNLIALKEEILNNLPANKLIFLLKLVPKIAPNNCQNLLVPATLVNSYFLNRRKDHGFDTGNFYSYFYL
ncbi:hypothetical protein AHMF7605_10155 [Adhaeribacter arboris]|uniref:Uncharacterized protein n=1 Tax=Adhaeribacter arboris TaxID=2072846 RepID=A0A2T2YEB4_9BACT|nr:hypothetical protein AHMF7605_10155 [Adhaeribacter arboris]